MRPCNLFVEGITPAHYDAVIADLQAAKAQLESMERREGQQACAICEDTGHTAEGCWYHNPLLLSVLGGEALLGEVYRCFHCGGVFTSQASAEEHFGKTPETPAECLRQLAALAEESAA